MRAVVFERHGGPDVLNYQEVPDPEPTDDQVLVEVEAIGVNFRDVYERRGEGGYGAEPPGVLGVEGAGRIVDSGERVAWVGVPGSYAELIAATEEQLVPVPEGVSSEVAAASLLQGMTAHYLAHDSYPIQESDWVLVHAGAGGVGLLLIQMARLRGGRVIATTSTDEKAALASDAGAHEVIDYDGFAERVRDFTGGMGMAAVYDGVGKATFMAGLDALAPAGCMILYGAASGRPDPLDPQMLAAKGSLYVQRPVLGTYIRTPELLRDRAGALFELIGIGALDVRIGEKYPLREARQAHEDLEARRTTGKLLLLP
jgi:NADPH:quinone reductase